MKPVNFPAVNMVYGNNQEGVEPLPANYNDGIVTTIWELDLVDLESIKETGKIILEIYTFGKPLQPVNILTIHENERRKQD